MPADIAAASGALRRRTLLAYGIGDAGTGMAAALVGFYLFVFYTAVAGLPAWLAGTVLMVVRIWDVISDQLIGWLGDHTHHRLGPRIPWMICCAVPLGLSMALMWWVPPFADPWRFLWFVLVASLFQATYSGVNLPYAALATELTNSTPLRTRLNTARFTGSVLASLVGLVAGAMLTHRGASGYWLLCRRRADRGQLAQCLGSRSCCPAVPPPKARSAGGVPPVAGFAAQPTVLARGAVVFAAVVRPSADAARRHHLLA